MGADLDGVPQTSLSTVTRTDGDLCSRPRRGPAYPHKLIAISKRVCRAIGIEGTHVHPHAFRHCFAASYVRRGGDIYRLVPHPRAQHHHDDPALFTQHGHRALQEGHERFSPLTPPMSGLGARR